jgi:uncharacterized protein YjbI with pentapeptide repeats
MAVKEHLEALRQHPLAWKDWRDEDPDDLPDLSNGDLRAANLLGKDLSEANLSGADLRGADLREADLSYANLKGANLCKADLRKADLRAASLHGADLSRADLSEANLCKATLGAASFARADLSNATLRKANLSEADLVGADFSGSILDNADLSSANLEGADLEGADLTKADLSGAILDGAIVRGANLSRAELVEAILEGADLSGANLTEANLTRAHLINANLSRANLSRANLVRTDLRGANLSEANLGNADLQYASLVRTNFTNTDLRGCFIYGMSAWDLHLQGATQRDLVITPTGEPRITVDNLEVGQFIYLLLNNEKIRHVIDTITSKVVLILGRFVPERKMVLNALRDELRRRDYLPVLFDFDKPSDRDITETVSLLAHMARFVVADITEARSIPQELGVIVPDLPSVPVQPLLLEGADEYGMFEHLKRYPWVLETYCYASPQELIASLAEQVIRPAEAKAVELQGRYRQPPRRMSNLGRG